MGFTIRFGGWRPVQLEEGQGVLRHSGGGTLEGVDYRFEVWHQMVGGFPGPFRAEGRLSPPDDAAARVLEDFRGGGVELELADGRLLEISSAPTEACWRTADPPRREPRLGRSTPEGRPVSSIQVVQPASARRPGEKKSD